MVESNTIEKYIDKLYNDLVIEYSNDFISEEDVSRNTINFNYNYYNDIDNIVKILSNEKYKNKVVVSYIIDRYKYKNDPTNMIKRFILSEHSSFIRSKYFIWSIYNVNILIDYRKLSLEIRDKITTVGFLFDYARYSKNQGRHILAMKYYIKCINLYNCNNSKYNLAGIYFDNEDYENALYYYQRYLMNKFEAVCLRMIAKCYFYLENSIESNRHFVASYRMFLSQGKAYEINRMFNEYNMNLLIDKNDKQISLERKIIYECLQNNVVKQLINIVCEYFFL
jgi:tetratricopeptide (TPR) repeat protein